MQIVKYYTLPIKLFNSNQTTRISFEPNSDVIKIAAISVEPDNSKNLVIINVDLNKQDDSKPVWKPLKNTTKFIKNFETMKAREPIEI